MTVHRFYAPSLDPSHPTVTLSPDEARHLTRVLRLGPGSMVSVFDGRGAEFMARVASIRRSVVTVQIVEPVKTAAESPLSITLAQSVLKSDKMDDVVRDAVMLGVAALQPLVSLRAESSLATLRKSKRVERWRRIAIASAKQCGRARISDVRDPVMLEALLASVTTSAEHLNLALVEPSQGRGRSLDGLKGRTAPTSTLVAIGPEGGWAAEEIEEFSAGGFHLVTLGSRTLRAEAAPLAVLTLLQFIWGDL